MNIGLPAGIGDISWWVSKVINAPEWNNGLKLLISDGMPNRAHQYLDMLDVDFDYANFVYEDILTFEAMNPYTTWKDVVTSGFGTYYMQPNYHLEQGKPLADYLPDLPTEYHYNLNTPVICGKKYFDTIRTGDWIGISAASYRGNRVWKTWGEREWMELLRLLIRDGYKICLLGGHWDDLTSSLENELDDDKHINLVGRTTFAQACAIHKFIPYYIGFSSGLGIIRSVMGLPTIMLWPAHQQPLATSWADPEDIRSEKYVALAYSKPSEIYSKFKVQESLWR